MKANLLLPALLLTSATLPAQREVSMPPPVQPGPADAVIAGDRLSRTITCRDRVPVYIKGAGNEVQIEGSCGLVRVEGNRNFVWVDRDGQVAVEGDNNVVFIRTSTTRVSTRGAGNRFELRR